MTVVAATRYRDGMPTGPAPLDHSPVLTSMSEFVWIGLFEPDEAEMRVVQDAYNLHPLAVEDALAGHQLPKIDVYGDHLFVVARTAHLNGDYIPCKHERIEV